MKKFNFIISLCAIISATTVLPMKRLPEDTLESLCTKKIAYSSSLMNHEQNEFEINPDFYYIPAENTIPEEMEPWNSSNKDNQSDYDIYCITPIIEPIAIKNINFKKKTYPCTFEGCNKSFTTKTYYNNHIRTHTGEKPFVCTVEGCNKSFADKANCKKHLRTHTDEKPFTCTIQGCNKSFKHNYSLTKHMQTHTITKPFIHTFEGYNKSCDLDICIDTDTNKKNYICPVETCKKSLRDKTDFNRHIRTHTSEKPYTCTIEGCTESFADKDNCKRHIRTHTNRLQNKGSIPNLFNFNKQMHTQKSPYADYENNLIFGNSYEKI